MAVKKFQIERSIDLTALTALVLSLFAAGTQLAAYWRGSELRLITPHRVVLYLDKAPGGRTVVHIAAPMAYANVAQEPYGDVVLEETAILKVGDRATRQEWTAFGKLDNNVLSATKPAFLLPVPGQDAVTHITLFTPIPAPCPAGAANCNPLRDYLSPEELAARAKNARKLEFEFTIRTADGSEIRKSCAVPMTAEVRTKIAELPKANLYAICREEGRGGMLTLT